MSDVTVLSASVPAMSASDVQKVGRLEASLRDMEQVPIQTTHHFHAGVYARTIRIPKGVVITGALIRIPTMLILSGHASVFVGGDTIELRGYHVLPASAGRKQVFLAHTDTDLTMIFPSCAKTVEEAEAEFTDETDLLMSREQQENLIIITGE
jgi:hypothetical protein